MNLLKTLYHLYKRKFEGSKATLKDETEVNTYYGKEPLKNQNRRFKAYHYVVKYKIIMPFLYIFKKWFDKKFKESNKEKMELPQFKFVKILDKAWDEATAHWHQKYICTGTKPKVSMKEARKLVKEEKTAKPLHMSKQAITTLFMHDDAYNEWLPLFLTEIYFRMGKFIETEPKGKQYYHLMHTVPKQMDREFEMVYLNMLAKINTEFHVQFGARQNVIPPEAKQNTTSVEESEKK